MPYICLFRYRMIQLLCKTKQVKITMFSRILNTVLEHSVGHVSQFRINKQYPASPFEY